MGALIQSAWHPHRKRGHVGSTAVCTPGRVLGRNQPCPRLDLSFPASRTGRRGFLGKRRRLWSLGQRLEGLIPWGSWNVAAAFQSTARFYSRRAVEFISYTALFWLPARGARARRKIPCLSPLTQSEHENVETHKTLISSKTCVRQCRYTLVVGQREPGGEASLRGSQETL